MLTTKEMVPFLDLEEREGSSAHPPICSEEAPYRLSGPYAPTRTVATEEGSCSAHSGLFARAEPRHTLRRLLRASEPFIDCMRLKGEKAPSEVSKASSDPHLTTLDDFSDPSALPTPSGFQTGPIHLEFAMNPYPRVGPYECIAKRVTRSQYRGCWQTPSNPRGSGRCGRHA